MIYFFCNRLRLTRTAGVAFRLLFAIFVGSIAVAGQTSNVRGKNNPYSPSPSPQTKQAEPRTIVFKIVNTEVSLSNEARKNNDIVIRPTAPQQTFKIAKATENGAIVPSEIYRIGAGDVLFINIKNASNASGYYTVRVDGTIDYPLAGENLVVKNKTTEAVEDMLGSGITIYSAPQVEVKVREFGSHKINVSGMVERPGEMNIQREAVPLYVVRAESGVNSQATKALIRRTNLSKAETFNLRDVNSDKVLIYPGNSIEFTADDRSSTPANSGFYYIAGNVNLTGQKELTVGMTLFQAILASGGTKGNPKKAMIRRKSDNGTLNVAEHNLRAIKDGKAPDPVLSPGDMIEIDN